MNSREDILSSIRANLSKGFELPMQHIETISYPDKTARFMEISTAVGGEAMLVKEGEDINALLRSTYPHARKIVSNIPEITIANMNPDMVENPQMLDGADLSVVRGQLGVAENGCVWIPQDSKERAEIFICEHLAILLDKNKIVNNMHDAYHDLTFNDYGFGTFISGPSKTADIEQALVIGAHGATSVTVFLI